MKLNPVVLGLSLAASAFSVLAAAPVVDVTTTPSISKNVGSISEQLANLERKLDSRNRAQVNVQRQLDELQNEVNELRGVTELHSHKLSQVLERQRELYQELDRRVSEALNPANNIPSAIISPNDAVSAVNYSSNLTENDAYDRAVNLVLKDKEYEKAIPEFRAFNAKYPNSSYAANANYWLGQLLFNKGENAEAKAAFEVVVNKFTDSTKRPDAMLKLAMVEQKQNNLARAKVLYNKVVSEYPSSSAAQLAKPRIQALGQ
jgi:tol-pal system protein YbgF